MPHRLVQSKHYRIPDPVPIRALGDALQQRSNWCQKLNLTVTTGHRRPCNSGDPTVVCKVSSFGFGGTNAHAMPHAQPSDSKIFCGSSFYSRLRAFGQNTVTRRDVTKRDYRLGGAQQLHRACSTLQL